MIRSVFVASLSSLLSLTLLVPAAHAAEVGDPCTTDSECGEGMWCEGAAYDQDGSGAGSSQGEGGSLGEGTLSGGEVLIEDGYCVRSPITCSVAGDCPEASQCSGGFCTFELTVCTDDAECDEGFVCTDGGEEEVCSVEPCVAGEECSDEEVCETVASVSFCFPAPVACSETEPCEGDWICQPMDDEGAPESWQGIEQACLPEGVVGAIEGWIAIDDRALGQDEDAPVSQGTGMLGSAGTGPVPTGEVATDGSGEAAKAEDDDGGCSVTRIGGAESGLVGLLLLAGGVLFGRRRQGSAAAAAEGAER